MPQLVGKQLGAAPVQGFCPEENDSNAESSDYSSLWLEAGACAHTRKEQGGGEAEQLSHSSENGQFQHLHFAKRNGL